MRAQALTKSQLQRLIRQRLDAHLIDDSGAQAGGAAIYTLSDPRDLREVRYVGQTRDPRRRLAQHLHCARLWLPDDLPWWVASPKLRPLYGWVRELYRNGARLPMMVVSAWVHSPRAARLAERTQIYECLERRLPLLNVESELLGAQLPLL